MRPEWMSWKERTSTRREEPPPLLPPPAGRVAENAVKTSVGQTRPLPVTLTEAFLSKVFSRRRHLLWPSNKKNRVNKLKKKTRWGLMLGWMRHQHFSRRHIRTMTFPAVEERGTRLCPCYSASGGHVLILFLVRDECVGEEWMFFFLKKSLHGFLTPDEPCWQL